MNNYVHYKYLQLKKKEKKKSKIETFDQYSVYALAS